MTAPSYKKMMWLGFGCVVAIAVGFLIGDGWMKRRRPPIPHGAIRLSTNRLLMAYGIGVVANSVLFRLAFDFPLFTQGILALVSVQLGLLYLVLRRLFHEDRSYLAMAILAFEVARGFSGFYSEFKEPVIVAVVAMAEVFRPKRAADWMMIVGLVVATSVSGVIWMGIRGSVREDFASDSARSRGGRLQFAIDEARGWWQDDAEYKLIDVDAFVERVWDIYYTSLALDRVPATIPYEKGALISAAIQHVVTPRFLNPNKPDLPSESESVRKYTGERVAGAEQGTTIAFGYVIQSYIDFGVPVMFLLPLAWGLLLGITYRFFVTTIRHEEILLAVLAVGFWSTIIPYNTAWAKWLGKFITGVVYIGAAAMGLDSFLSSREQQDGASAAAHPLRVS
jgi:hypothetical protein